MHITYKGDYALKTILDLALHYGESPVTIHELAERADIPVKFLEQILLDLKRGGFVVSRRGKVGGYFLARVPNQIKLGEVIRYIDGPIEPVACVDRKYRGCDDIAGCILRHIWEEVARSTARIVDNITFEDLVKKLKQKSAISSYSI